MILQIIILPKRKDKASVTLLAFPITLYMPLSILFYSFTFELLYRYAHLCINVYFHRINMKNSRLKYSACLHRNCISATAF